MKRTDVMYSLIKNILHMNMGAVHVFEHQGGMWCHRESQCINPAVCVDSMSVLWLRKDLMKIQYIIDFNAII